MAGWLAPAHAAAAVAAVGHTGTGGWLEAQHASPLPPTLSCRPSVPKSLTLPFCRLPQVLRRAPFVCPRRVLVQVDNPQVPADVLSWLRQQQRSRLDGMRVRINQMNQASGCCIAST